VKRIDLCVLKVLSALALALGLLWSCAEYQEWAAERSEVDREVAIDLRGEWECADCPTYPSSGGEDYRLIIATETLTMVAQQRPMYLNIQWLLTPAVPEETRSPTVGPFSASFGRLYLSDENGNTLPDDDSPGDPLKRLQAHLQSGDAPDFVSYLPIVYGERNISQCEECSIHFRVTIQKNTYVRMGSNVFREAIQRLKLDVVDGSGERVATSTFWRRVRE